MLIILRRRGKIEMIRCVLLHCWWKCGERESGSGIDLPCSMTPCYFSRLCGQRFRELVNGKWESERSGGEERKKETYRQKDWEKERQEEGQRDRVVGYTTHQCISCSFVPLLMLLITASDVSHLCLFESDMKSDNMLLIKWPAWLEWSVSALGHVGGFE